MTETTDERPILKMWGSGPMWKSSQDIIKPLTQAMKERLKEREERFNERVVAWGDATRNLSNHKPCPTPGCTAGSPETGRICSALPHTSSGPSESLLPNFSIAPNTDTINSLGTPPADFKNEDQQ